MSRMPLALAAVLAACAPRLPAAKEVPARWGPYTLELVGDSGRALPTFAHRGRTYVLGALGGRYLVRFRNGSSRRVEVVASVDGLDVVDGRSAAFEKRGYVVEPHGELTIDGFRLSSSAVAAFRFSSVPRSYAARQGDARDVGVIGLAVFPDRAPQVRAAPAAPPWRDEEGASAHRGDGRSRGAEAAPSEAGGRPPEAGGPPAAAEAAPAPGHDASRLSKRPGLGTEFGEEHASWVTEVAFERASERPDAVLTLRYDDRPGLLALGIDVDRDRLARRDDASLRESARPFRSEPGYCEPPRGWRAGPR
jgi:hypothetical protein